MAVLFQEDFDGGQKDRTECGNNHDRRMAAVLIDAADVRRPVMVEKAKPSTFTEELEVTGQQVADEIARLLAEGNVRRLLLKSETGDIIVTVPLTAGAIVGGVVVLAAPWLALFGAIVGLATKLRIEVVREEPHSEDVPPDTGEAAPGGD